jgi:hypothetical protein
MPDNNVIRSLDTEFEKIANLLAFLFQTECINVFFVLIHISISLILPYYFVNIEKKLFMHSLKHILSEQALLSFYTLWFNNIIVWYTVLRNVLAFVSTNIINDQSCFDEIVPLHRILYDILIESLPIHCLYINKIMRIISTKVKNRQE